MADFFNIVFAGEISGGADPAAVRANIARIFKASDAMVEKLFSGQRIAVKKAVDQATAMKYRAVMKQAGAIAHIEPCDEQGKPLAAPAPAPAPVQAERVTPVASAPAAPVSAPASMPASAPAAAAAPQPETMAQRVARLHAEQEAANALKPKPDAPPPPAVVERVETWKLFPVGSVLSEIKTAPAPMMPTVRNFGLANLGTELLQPEERAELAPVPVAVPDVSAIKMAPRGSDLIKAEEKAAEIPVAVDISSMTMAPPNTEVLKPEEKRVVVPVVVDVSAMSMAPPGADLEQIREEKKPVNPDISKLKLA